MDPMTSTSTPIEDGRPRRKFSKPPVKLACLSCRALRIRCSGQQPCTNCIAKGREHTCCYTPSKRGGPRNCKNRRKRTLAPKKEESTPRPQDPAGQPAAELVPGLNDDEWLDQLVGLSDPGAGLRNVEMPISEIESIFDSIFQQNDAQAGPNPHSTGDLVQTYESDEDILDAYYIFIHPYYPILPPPERVPVLNRQLSSSGKSSFQSSSPLSLAVSAILVLIPHAPEKNPFKADYVRLRRELAHSYAQSALEAIEVDSELLSSSNDPSNALSDGAPEFNRGPLHPKVPVCLESILALVLLSVYEYAQRGNMTKMRNRAGQALTAAMEIGLHEIVEEDEFAEAKRRAWWMTYVTVCQGSIVSSSTPVFDLFDPRFVTPFPTFESDAKAWKIFVESQQTILAATTFVHDLEKATKSSYDTPWVPQRMLELDSQIEALLLLCRGPQSLSRIPQSVSVDQSEGVVAKTMRCISEIKLQSARIKTHRFSAFQDLPIFAKRHCDLAIAGSTTIPTCCSTNTAPLSPSSSNTSSPAKSDIHFPFSSHASSKICLVAALNISILLDSLPYPSTGTWISDGIEETCRTMPTFACCAMQASYAMLMLCFKTRAFHQVTGAAGGEQLAGFMSDLQRSLGMVVKALANYSMAFEALRGMRDEISDAVERVFSDVPM